MSDAVTLWSLSDGIPCRLHGNIWPFWHIHLMIIYSYSCCFQIVLTLWEHYPSYITSMQKTISHYVLLREWYSPNSFPNVLGWVVQLHIDKEITGENTMRLPCLGAKELLYDYQDPWHEQYASARIRCFWASARSVASGYPLQSSGDGYIQLYYAYLLQSRKAKASFIAMYKIQCYRSQTARTT
jgi:hypothetical protein